MVIEPETNPFWVHVLVSESTGRRDIGQTEDLPRRLAEHNRPPRFTARILTTLPNSEFLVRRTLPSRFFD
jgi:predicted GIY-YIG superfamily endonuclease